MAKKKTAAGVAGPGQKACPACGTINGARSAECKKCHHKFEIKSGGGSRGKKDGMGAVRAIVDYVNDRGSLADAKDDLARWAELIKATGGLSEALAAIETVEAIKAMK